MDGMFGFEFRYSQGQPARLPALAAELVQSKVDAILTAGTESTDAARKADQNDPHCDGRRWRPDRRANSSRLGTVRAGLYARVSTDGQTPENQLLPLRAFAAARGWRAQEFIDHGVSGGKDRRPALDALLGAVRARQIDVVAVTKLDRLARSTRHLVTLAAELQALGVELVVLGQAIDTTTPAGRLLFHVLAAISEFERDLIRDRVLAGLRRARLQGRHLGRPRRHEVDAERARTLLAEGRSLRATARVLGVPHVAVSRALASLNDWNKPHAEGAT
jgi:DNA invertase Pin-like site-specific DNA recombinase